MAGTRRRDDRRVLGTAACRQSASYDQDHRSRAFGPTRTNRARARPLRTLGDLYGPRKRQEVERVETTTPITEGSTCKRNLASLGPIPMQGLVRWAPRTYPARESCSTRSLAARPASVLLPKRPSKAKLSVSSPSEDLADRSIHKPTEHASATRRCESYTWVNAGFGVPRWGIGTSALVLQWISVVLLPASTPAMKSLEQQPLTPVRFQFRNIGPVREAELELGRLTIIAGRNNTGKTYLSYTIYGLIKAFQNSSTIGEPATSDELQFIQDLVQDLEVGSVVGVPFSLERVHRERKLLLDWFSGRFSESHLAKIFSSSRKAFSKSSVSLQIPECESHRQIDGQTGQIDHADFSFQYDGNTLRISPAQRDSYYSHRSLLTGYRHFLVPELTPKISIISAERFGISLFYKELDFTKNQLVDMLQGLRDQKNRDDNLPWMILDRASSRYALPIKDNIQFTRSISQLNSKKSEFFDKNLFSRIEALMGGGYSASDDEIRFFSKTQNPRSRFNVPLHHASSSARGLSDLYFFLVHQVSDNHLLIIDEPESHLDTANQVQLARMVAHFIRAGVRILITTHSDYFLKEINNLIMLNKDFNDKPSVMKSLGYAKDDFIDPNLIRAYIAENHSLTRCVIDQLGIDLPLYDEVIRSINHASSELSSRVLD